MPRFNVTGEDALAVSTTVMALDGTSTTRGSIYDIVVGCNATPADNAYEFNLRRFGPANGTGTAVTPVPLDTADAAAEIDGTTAHTTEASVTANNIILSWAQNQRATFRWVAAPGGELIMPATTDVGIALFCENVSGSGVTVTASFHFSE